MALARTCGACKRLIPQQHHVELTIRIIRTAGEPEQDALEETLDDYCDGCVATGEAINDLVSGLTKYKGLEAERLRRLVSSDPASVT